MPATLHEPVRRDRRARPPRPAWKQRLAQAERGLTAGFRSDSVFFVHLFVGSLAVAAAGLIGFAATEWAVLALALTVTTGSELFRQALIGLRPLVARLDADAAAPGLPSRRRRRRDDDLRVRRGVAGPVRLAAARPVRLKRSVRLKCRRSIRAATAGVARLQHFAARGTTAANVECTESPSEIPELPA